MLFNGRVVVCNDKWLASGHFFKAVKEIKILNKSFIDEVAENAREYPRAIYLEQVILGLEDELKASLFTVNDEEIYIDNKYLRELGFDWDNPVRTTYHQERDLLCVFDEEDNFVGGIMRLSVQEIK